MSLIALTASCTDQVDLENVFVPDGQLLCGPENNVLAISSNATKSNVSGAGGVQTSTLAVGHSIAAIKNLKTESRERHSLRAIADRFSDEAEELVDLISRLSLGESCIAPTDLRQRANSLVLRTTQAALQASKGAGFVSGHPAGRCAKEALFFLVWSCPQAVIDANLCDLAGLDSPTN
jgi:alkylation response protein AidB-like acyl-CoA dehydrogenase